MQQTVLDIWDKIPSAVIQKLYKKGRVNKRSKTMDQTKWVYAGTLNLLFPF